MCLKRHLHNTFEKTHATYNRPYKLYYQGGGNYVIQNVSRWRKLGLIKHRFKATRHKLYYQVVMWAIGIGELMGRGCNAQSTRGYNNPCTLSCTYVTCYSYASFQSSTY